MSRFRTAKAVFLAFEFSAAVPAAVASIQAPAAAIDQPEDVGGGMRCRECTVRTECYPSGVCIVTRTCGAWYNC